MQLVEHRDLCLALLCTLLGGHLLDAKKAFEGIDILLSATYHGLYLSENKTRRESEAQRNFRITFQFSVIAFHASTRT